MADTGYESSIARLRSVLPTHARDAEVWWVFAEDLLWRNGRLWIRMPTPKENARLVRRAFDAFPRLQHGLEVTAVGVLPGEVVCTMWLPNTQQEAEQMMIAGAKVRAWERMADISVVTSRLKWSLARAVSREDLAEAEFMTRAEFQRRLTWFME